MTKLANSAKCAERGVDYCCALLPNERWPTRFLASPYLYSALISFENDEPFPVVYTTVNRSQSVAAAR